MSELEIFGRMDGDDSECDSNGYGDEQQEEKIGGDCEVSEVVPELEKRYALDTAALLGGNEYLVSQMLEKLSQTPYTPEERSALLWVIQRLSPDDKERTKIMTEKEEIHQGLLTDFFTEYHQERLPRTLANVLLYCGRFPDTEILHNPSNNRQRVIIINMKNYPQVELPISDCNPFCSRLAFLYIKIADELPQINMTPPQQTMTAPANRRARKISASLAHERKMLSLVNVFAILPVP